MRAHLLLVAAAAWLSACSESTEAAPPPPSSPVAGPLAFPGALGHGAASKGGRGGRIMAVNTLEDSGGDTLRACLEAEGPRVCVFRVGGTIRFTGPPPIIRNPLLTIAGQTAPGGGITLAHDGGPEARTPLLIKNTHDVVVRHIRVRLDRTGAKRGSEDAFTIENSQDVILDHVSGSWARDESVNPYGDNDRITISRSIFAEGLPPHDKCALLGSDPKGAQNMSFIGNLCAHHGDRNPDVNFVPGSCVEVVNNVFYNAQSQFAEVWESYGGTPVSIVGNSFRAGRNTHADTIGIAREILGSRGLAKIYLWDNSFQGTFAHLSPLAAAATVAAPSCPLTLSPLAAAAAADAVLAQAGALPRDATDVRIVQEVRTRGGRIVREPGVIVEGAAGTPYPDDDGDGMDDRWEATHGAVVGRPDAWGDADRDGSANLDEFLDAVSRGS